MTRHKFLLFALPLALLLAGCGGAEKKKEQAKKEPEKPAEPVTGRYALHQMFMSARGWNTDAQVLQLRSIGVQGVTNESGKWGAWQAMFVSPGRGRARSYTYSVVEAEGNLHKGVFAGLEETWGGPRGQTKPFLMAALKSDSDEALKVALEKGGEYAKKHPEMPVHFLLEHNTRFPDPSWRVIWGETVGTSNFSIFVDAMTGKYLQTMR